MVGVSVGVSVGEDEGMRVMATGYVKSGSIGSTMDVGEDVGRTGEGIADGSGIVAVGVEPV